MNVLSTVGDSGKLIVYWYYKYSCGSNVFNSCGGVGWLTLTVTQGS